jgi:CBS domain-containing protein
MTLKDALMLMRREQVLRLPVVNANGVFQGILSINDVVLNSETGGANDKEKVQTFLTVDDIKAGYTLLAPSEETPPAFDEKGLALLRESSTNQTKIKSQ